MKRQRTLTACVALVAASVLVAGCGGDDEKSDKADEGKIAGTETSAPAKPSPTASEAAGEKDGPDLSLPKDLKVVSDWREPADAEKAAALRGARNFVTGLLRGITRQDVDDPAYQYYSYPASSARSQAKANIQLHIDHGQSVTGTRRLHKESVQVIRKHETAVVSFCVDDHDYNGKKVKTGEIVDSGTSENAYGKYELGMVSTNGSHWVAKELKANSGDAECA
ncbi:hypothetical protein [Streptomyces sp. AM 3-1-1]|uniref:hypothetical protein n=1 Tax=Streptomyces sp. AM 3-1-1 TaxID=3028711 RepID=UPI0023B8DBF6|nr:hypothetical protein [Streptomyces sp. AM 3-1-1]WEH29265.1 hypothetical protein P0D76_19155 [Streptomyces sp. AM 3-1-1]